MNNQFSSNLNKIFKKYGLTLAPTQINQFDIYANFLLEYNKKVNITNITNPDDIIIKHFLDSAIVLKLTNIEKNSSFIDIGSGGGFPAIPIKIIRGDLNITMVDSLKKRTTFLQKLINELNINADIIHSRAEDIGRLSSFREKYSYAAARAISHLSRILEYCVPFVQVNGMIIAYKSSSINTELVESKNALSLLKTNLEKIKFINLPNNLKRSLIFFKKKSQTPPQYPRISGAIQKNFL